MSTKFNARRKDRAPEAKLTIVALGASAGGLSALKEVFGEVDANAPVAFVIVQHLAEGDHALAIKTLARLTPLDVRELEAGDTLSAGVVYYAPARMNLSIQNGLIQLSPARSADNRLAVIDHAFAALATVYAENLVGVVLSGEASDGALGLGAINAAGGLTLVQTPSTADHRSMPEAALATGLIDQVLPPRKMWAQIKAYVGFAHTPGARLNLQDEISRALHAICDVLHERTSHDFKHYKTSTLIRRIQRRIQVLHLASVDDYVEMLRSSPVEAEMLFKELLINVTAFFRDPEAFSTLYSEALTPLVRAARTGQKIRIWIPGCSTGEEAYTLAILMKEAMTAADKVVEVQILATDIDDAALSIARRGGYGASIADAVSPERLGRYFTKRAGRYHVTKDIREMCLFSIHNLINDPPFSQVDLISCRNLLIYLGSHLQQKIFPVFHYALRHYGYLFLGTSETLTSHRELFGSVDAKHRILQRKPTAIKLPSLKTNVQSYVGHFRDTQKISETDLGLIGQRIALDEMPLRYAIVNDEGQILSASGDLSKYLQFSEGAFLNNVIKLVVPSLRPALRGAFARARKEQRKITNDQSTITAGKKTERILVIVQPMPRLGDLSELYWVAFQSLGLVHARTSPVETISAESAEIVDQLERELNGIRRELERTVQDLEASNEELKSSNEELLSMNEELQSANEELEASKEDVQNTNNALHRANLDLENLLASTQIATLFLDDHFCIRGFTPAIKDIYNVRPGDVGRPLSDFTMRAKTMPAYPDLPFTDELAHDDVNMPDGRVFLRRILPYRTTEHRRDGAVVTFIDVTDIRRSEDRFRRMANSVPVLTWTASPDGLVEFFNSRWYEYTGHDPSESLGSAWASVLHPADLERTQFTWARSLATGDDYEIEYRLRRADGQYRWHRGTGIAMRDQSGLITAWFGTCVDVQEQREKTDLLEESGRSLRTIIEAIPQYVWRTTPDGAADYASERFRKFTGRTEEQLLGWGWFDLIHPEDRPAVQLEWAERRAAEAPVLTEFRIRRGTDEGYRWVRSEGNPYFNSAGELEKYYGTWADVDDQKRASEAVKSSESHFRSLVDNSPATMWITDREARCTYLSTRWYDITGRTPEQDLGFGWVENIHPEDRQEASDLFFAAVRARGRLSVRYRLRHRDGTYRWSLDSGLPLISADREFMGYIGTVIDIHDQVVSEEGLSVMRERFDRSTAATDLGIWYCDLPFDQLIWNAEVRRHFFVTPDQPVTIEDFYAHIHPDDRTTVRTAIDFSIENHAPYDVYFRTYDRVDLNKVKRIRAIGWTDYDGDAAIRFDGITLDVSREHAREEELKVARHVAEVANESKTRFLANMSHEIRTPLSAIVGYSELLNGLIDAPSNAQKYVERISRNSVHLGRLIDELLDLSKIEANMLEVERVPVELERVVEDVLSAMHLKADQKGLALEVTWSVDRAIRVVTDPVRLAQVLTNIVGNAVKFTERGSVEVGIALVDEHLHFKVTDTGIGLAPHQRDRLFEAFSQADPSVSRKYGGTGLGLNLSRKLARLLGGDLRLDSSEVGRGSVFVIDIAIGTPLTASAPAVDLPNTVPATLRDRSILVVDDSPDNRTIVGLFLESAGARVTEATNGREGVAAATAGSFDLVLMDIQMPTMDGYQALQTLRALAYGRPIVALTAHAFKEERDRCLSVGFADYITKPVNRPHLIETLSALLERSPQR